MSGRWWKAPETAFLDRRLQKLPAGLFRLWFNLNCVASWSGGRLPSLADVAFLLRTSPKALARRLELLEEAGLLFCRGEEIALAMGNAGAPDADDRPAGAEPLSGAERTRRWRERRDAGDGGCDARDVTVTALEKEKEEKETDSSRVTREECDEIFEKFWSAFPARDGDNPKAPALTAWRKAIAEGAKPEALVSAARSYAAATRDREKRFICSAVRWLSEGRWNDAKSAAPAGAFEPPGVWIEARTPEWEAWAAHWCATRGRAPPIDSKGGWRFPSKVPPSAEEIAA